MRLAVFASGSGTLLDAILATDLPVELVLVDRPCRAAELAGPDIHTEVLSRSDWSSSFDRVAYSEAVVEVLHEHRIELVAMAGFGTVLTDAVFNALPGRIVNTHPSLLPSFPGWHAVRDALDHGVKVTGCTVHVATPVVDAGPILAQEAVAVHDDDTEATLHERIKVVERRLYVQTLHALCKNTDPNPPANGKDTP